MSSRTIVSLVIHETNLSQIKVDCKILIEVCLSLFLTVCGTVRALEAASLHPAKLLGISDKKGTLNFDSDADFIVLNDDLVVLATYIAGECVWSKAKIWS